MSPETGNFFKLAAQITVSVSIKLSHSMSPETGNKEVKQKKKKGSTIYHLPLPVASRGTLTYSQGLHYTNEQR